jgi:protein SCO1/2
MASLRGILVLALIASAACSREPAARQYELKGQIISVGPQENEVLVKHEDIPGFMPAMTMPYTVSDPQLLSDKQPGDLITATLLVGQTEAHLSAITRTGHAPIAPADAQPPIAHVLTAGEPVPDTPLTDERGMPRPLSSLRGSRVVLTFMYTRCPLPEFCPLMDRNFVTLQNEIKEDPQLRDVRLVSVSFDPAFDTPPVLQAHARSLKADPAIWHFVTAGADDIKAFALRFGVVAEPDPSAPGTLTHNLATAIIDREGRLLSLRAGNSWTPAELVADLKAPPASGN